MDIRVVKEKVAGSPLHIYALKGVSIVTGPELVEVGESAPVNTSATRSAVLDGEVGVFGTDALQYLL